MISATFGRRAKRSPDLPLVAGWGAAQQRAFDERLVALAPQLRLDGAGSGRGSTMRNPKIAMLWYGLAVGFILVVAFHSPAKVLVASEALTPTTALSAK